MHGVTAILGTRFLIETDSEKFVLIVDKGKVRFTRKYDGEKIELGSGQMIEFTARSSTTNKLEAKTIDPYTREKLFGGNSKLYLNF
jgi:ferric-dicitrate binding protein FerR (iron transport regulator)